MTALDIQNHHFPRRLRGYDVDEVEQFRAAVAEDFESLAREAEALRRRVGELEARIGKMDAEEQALRDALVTAQGISDELRRTSEREAQMRVGEAEVRAEKILGAAHRQAARLSQDIRELRTLRMRMASSVRATIETHLALLDGFSGEPDEEEWDADTLSRIESLASPTATGSLPAPSRAAEPEGSARSWTGWTVLHDGP
jgi:cell division initiation protein